MNRTPKTIEELFEYAEVRNCIKLCSHIQSSIIDCVDLEDIRDAAAIQNVRLIGDFHEISDVFTIDFGSTDNNDYISVRCDPSGGRVVISGTYNVSTGLVQTMYFTSNNSPIMSLIFGKKHVIVNSTSYTYDDLEALLFQLSTANTKINLDFLNTRIAANVQSS